ncbi:MAG: hypothetical protein IPN19_07070 [Elusimicrobia bacterium]|nr:hypothetical protein [Elusimicrobiota bacterium]
MTLVEKLLDFSSLPDEWADYEQVRVRGEEVDLEPLRVVLSASPRPGQRHGRKLFERA